jgi:hypothetical protein
MAVITNSDEAWYDQILKYSVKNGKLESKQFDIELHTTVGGKKQKIFDQGFDLAESINSRNFPLDKSINLHVAD